MLVGYFVKIQPELASFRFRVAIPSQYLNNFVVGDVGDVTFFYKHDPRDLGVAKKCSRVVFDVVNDHFIGQHREHYLEMCRVADIVTVGSEAMARIVRDQTWRDPVVIDDPYENNETYPSVCGEQVVWFGHQANLSTLAKLGEIANLGICTGDVWSLANERACLKAAAVVLLTGKPTASSNRVVKALRAGRFVVTPGGVESWEQFKDYIWIGDVRKGIAWALANREEACSKILAGQKYTRERFSPRRIGEQWMDVFALTSAAEIRDRQGGSQ